MSDKKICPLFAVAVVMAATEKMPPDVMQEASMCMNGSCAWWNDERKACGMAGGLRQ